MEKELREKVEVRRCLFLHALLFVFSGAYRSDVVFITLHAGGEPAPSSGGIAASE